MGTVKNIDKYVIEEVFEHEKTLSSCPTAVIPYFHRNIPLLAGCKLLLRQWDMKIMFFHVQRLFCLICG